MPCQASVVSVQSHSTSDEITPISFSDKLCKNMVYTKDILQGSAGWLGQGFYLLEILGKTEKTRN